MTMEIQLVQAKLARSVQIMHRCGQR